MKLFKYAVPMMVLSICACMSQVRTQTFRAAQELPTVSLGGPYEDTLYLSPQTMYERTIRFTSNKEWRGEIWFTQTGASSNVFWRQLTRYPELDKGNRIGWIYQYRVLPRYIGSTRLEIEPDGYKPGTAYVTIQVLSPLKTY